MLLFTDNRGGPHSKLTTLEPSAEEDGVLAAKCSSSLTNTGLHANDSTERKYIYTFVLATLGHSAVMGLGSGMVHEIKHIWCVLYVLYNYI